MTTEENSRVSCRGYNSYLGGGGTLGLGITFGYLAGQHAAAQSA